MSNTFNSRTGTWTPHPQGFPTPGATDVTPKKATGSEPVDLVAAIDMTEALRDLQEQFMAAFHAEQAFVSEQYLAGQALRNEAAASVREATAEIEKLAQEAADLEKDRVADRIAEIGDAFEYLGNAALEGGEYFKRALADMARSLAVSGLRDVFENFLGNLVGGGGFVGRLISGARAYGGPVSANSTYMVGEKGPELFVPKTSGTIIPNASSPAMGGSSTVLNMPIDARGAQQGVAEQLARVAPAIVEAAFRRVNKNLPQMMIRAQRDAL